MLEDILWAIERFFKAVKRFPRHFCLWLKKSAEYSIFLWNDYDWDYHYIFRLLKFKLARVRKDIENDKWHLNHMRYAKQVKLCEILLDRLMKDDYCDLSYTQHLRKWGTPKSEYIPVGNDLYEWKVTYPNAKTAEENEQAKRERTAIYKQEHYLKQQDIEYLFKTLAKRIQGWWT